jgi:hypothetical protein
LRALDKPAGPEIVPLVAAENSFIAGREVLYVLHNRHGGPYKFSQTAQANSAGQILSTLPRILCQSFQSLQTFVSVKGDP